MIIVLVLLWVASIAGLIASAMYGNWIITATMTLNLVTITINLMERKY